MASDLGSKLHERLSEDLPATWLVGDAADINGATRKVTLTYEQGDISALFKGQELALGSFAVDFALTLSVPATARKGLPALNECVFTLCAVLDTYTDLSWTTAERGQFEDTGEAFYRFPVTVITNYNPAPEEE